MCSLEKFKVKNLTGINRMYKSSFLRFCIVGTIGFVVDASVVWILTQKALDPIISQIIAFSIAVLITWILNRNFSFSKSQKKLLKELIYYVLGTSFGSIVTNGIYIFLVLRFSVFHDEPVFAVSIGSLFGLIFNFTVSKFFVFKT